MLIDMRHAVAHSADLDFSEDHTKRHALENSILVKGCLDGRSLVYSREGTIVSLSVTEQNLDKLLVLKASVYNAFQTLW